MPNSNYNTLMQAIKNKLTTLKNGIVSIFTPPIEWIQRKYRNNKKKCIGTLLSLAILTLLTGLIVGSFKSVNSVNQGVPINYSEGTIKDYSQPTPVIQTPYEFVEDESIQQKDTISNINNQVDSLIRLNQFQIALELIKSDSIFLNQESELVNRLEEVIEIQKLK